MTRISNLALAAAAACVFAATPFAAGRADHAGSSNRGADIPAAAPAAWKRVPLARIEGAFVAGPAHSLPVMVSDSGRQAAPDGTGLGQDDASKPFDLARPETCFACHDPNVKLHDFVVSELAR